jgi:hypothetical protein
VARLSAWPLRDPMWSTDLGELTVAYQDMLHFAGAPAEAVDTAIALAADPTAYPKGAEKELQS